MSRLSTLLKFYNKDKIKSLKFRKPTKKLKKINLKTMEKKDAILTIYDILRSK